MTAQGNKVKHRELWQRLDEQCQLVTIHWRQCHVKGHSGNPNNEAADRLASTATDSEILENNNTGAPTESMQKDPRRPRVVEKVKEAVVGPKSATCSSQTYPSKVELHTEELLSAFQSMESQVLNILQNRMKIREKAMRW